eukprot:TRINITY_DN9822_c0_g6_i2.p1 TRINITY_DN9822_c0_g6~~TRINITY_DN9822_c0_g6_i2.p1  ORF type:complete len:125 (-),score=23.59 TRINITY_DN9822_c0_g6_i2:97-471(-)
MIDTAGNDDFSAMVDAWIEKGDAFMLVFSIVDVRSLESAESRYARVLKRREAKMIPMVLVGNKCDLEDKRVVDKGEAAKMSEEWGIEYVETSAKVNASLIVGKNKQCGSILQIGKKIKRNQAEK